MIPTGEAENSQSQHESSGQQAPEQAGAGNIDNIREILFGAQMRDYEGRFARLEETLLKDSADMRESMRRRFDTLEAYSKREVEAMQARLKSEREERSASMTQQSRELKELGETLFNRLRDLDDRGADFERDLRQQSLQQAKDLMDEIGSKHEQISSLLERRFHELRQGKADRATLANLLTEIAMRLNEQFHLPASEK